MGWITLTTTLIGDLVWPAVVVWVLFFFRSPIKRLINRIKVLKWRDFQADLEDGNESIHEATKERRKKPSKPSTAAPAPDVTELTKTVGVPHTPNVVQSPLIKLTETPLVGSPRLENWKELKDLVMTSPEFVIHIAGEVLDAAVRKAVDKPLPSGSLNVTMALRENPRFSEKLVEGIIQLQRYRNHVAGNVGLVLDPADARTFVDSVASAIELLEEGVNQL